MRRPALIRQLNSRLPDAGRTARTVAGAAVLLSLIGLVFSVLYAIAAADYSRIVSHVILNPFITAAYALIGALVTSRQPRNSVGWMFLAVSALFALDIGAGAVRDFTAAFGGAPVPAVQSWGQWFAIWSWMPGVFLPTSFVLLLFPDGRVLTARWRIVFWAAASGLLLSVLGLALHPGPLPSWGTGLNPFGITAAAPALEALLNLGALLLVVGFVGSLAAFAVRFGRTQGPERKQMKWPLYGVLLMLLGFIITSVIWFLIPEDPLVLEIGIAFSNLSILGIAVAAAVAILRYRLYDIDFIINRTLVYALLTIIVAGAYGVVVSTTGFFLQVDSNVAGLLVTVALVFLFIRPLRASVQQGVDVLVGPATPVAAPRQPPAAAADPPAASMAVTGPGVLVLVTSLLVGLAIAFLWLRLATPFADDRVLPGESENGIVADGVMVTPLAATAAGLQPGDVVIAIEDKGLADWLTTTTGQASFVRSWQVGDTLTYVVERQGRVVLVPVTLRPFPLGAVLQQQWGTMLFYAVTLLIAGYVFLRRPQLMSARLLFLAAAGQFSASTWSLGLNASDFAQSAGFWIYNLTTLAGFMLVWIAYFHFTLVFPQPAGILRRRWFVPLLYALPYFTLLMYFWVTYDSSANLLDWVRVWGRPTGLSASIFLCLGLATIIWQYRRSHGETRRQIRWLFLAAFVVAGSAVVIYFMPPLLAVPAVDANIMGLIGILFPLAVAVSIMRHNLFDIDTLLNRALVYGALTVTVIALYVLVVGVLGSILQTRSNLLLSLVATGLAAILFQPLRDRLQKGANRLLYGERDEPFEVLARLGGRLESTLSPAMVYPTVVETVSQALKLPYVAVAIWRGGQLETVQSYGRPVPNPVKYPLTYQGERVGELQVAPRTADETFSPADERILRNIARQAGAAVHAVQLMADLQQSRQQLVTAREEERRRLRRDLHDGLGPQLASQTLTIEAIDRLLEADPGTARALLRDLKAQSKAAVADIRRLVYELRPPALDELGLVGALADSALRQSRNGLRVRVEADGDLPPLPAAVEVAAYRVAGEAMTNAVRHAGATTCTVRLSLEPGKLGRSLCVEIQDDGRGLPAEYQAGVGLHSMRERAAELGGSCQVTSPAGGGVRVTALFPLPPQDG